MIRMSDQDRELGKFEKLAHRVKEGRKVAGAAGTLGGVVILAKKYAPDMAKKVSQLLAKKR